MSQTLLETRRRRLPTRQCSLCGRGFGVLELIRVRKAWLCATCYHEQVISACPPDEAREVTSQGHSNAHEPGAMWALRTADTLVRTGCIALKLVLYVTLWAISKNTAVGPHILAGFFLADGITWLLAAVYDWSFHRRAVLIEVAFYGGLLLLWMYAGLAWPEAAEDKALLALTALGTAAVKVGLKAMRVVTGDD